MHRAAYFDILNHVDVRATPVNVRSTPAMMLAVVRNDIMITFIGVLVGALLGTRYRVPCLVPIIPAGIAILAVSDRFNDVPASSTVLTALALGLALQIGYLIGLTTRSMLLAAFTRRQQSRALAR